MSTNYAKVQANLFDPAHARALDGPGVLLLLLQVAALYDSSSAIDSTNPYNDVVKKLSAAIPDSPLRREVFQVLSDRATKYATGQH